MDEVRGPSLQIVFVHGVFQRVHSNNRHNLKQKSRENIPDIRMKVTPSQKSPRVLSLFYGRNSSSGNGDLIE